MKKTRVTLAALLLLGLASGAQALLTDLGPVNLQNGMPLWFQDSTGLQLSLCADPADPNCGAVAGPDAGNRFSQQIGFGGPGEAFWWAANEDPSSFVNPAGPNSRVVIAVESAFLNGIFQGGQSVFGRVRFAFDVDVPGNYTILHPFGTEGPFTVAAGDIGGGPELKNVGADVLGAPTDLPKPWAASLGTAIGPFLQASVPAPPVGYVGNAVTGSTVINGPVRNFVQINGPAGAFGGAGSLLINRFIVIGKIFNANAAVPIPNTAPVANADVAVTGGVTPVTIDVVKFLAPAGTPGKDLDVVALGTNNFDINPKAVGIVETPPVPGFVFNIDPDKPTLTANGKVVRNPDGTVTYTPNVGAPPGTDTFQYVVQDAGGLVSAPATVTVTVLRFELTEAVFRPKLMKWSLNGICTAPDGTVVDVFAGPTADPAALIGTTTVAGGTWAFEGKSTQSPAGLRNVSIQWHDPATPAATVTVPNLPLTVR